MAATRQRPWTAFVQAVVERLRSRERTGSPAEDPPTADPERWFDGVEPDDLAG